MILLVISFRDKAEGYFLSEKEILSFCSLLLNAGHDTTINLIGNLVFSKILKNLNNYKKIIIYKLYYHI
jgi:cytochrome P450